MSGFVALTLTPMLCSKLLRHNPKPNVFDRGVERGLVAITRGYTVALRGALEVRWLVVAVMLVSAGASWWLFRTAKSELAPVEDRGVIALPVRAPTVRRSSTPRATSTRSRRSRRSTRSSIGASSSWVAVRFRAPSAPSVPSTGPNAAKSTAQLQRELMGRLIGLPGVSAFPITPPSLGQGFRSRPIEYVILSGDSYENMARVAQNFVAELQKRPGIVQPDIDLQLNKPEIFLEVDRARAADLGVSVEAVARTVETMLGGRVVTRYKRDAEQYDVLLQMSSEYRATPSAIDDLFVRGRNDTMLPLAAVVKVREAVSPRELNHFNQRRSVTITANLTPDMALGEALEYMDATAARVLPAGYATELNGVSREFRASSGALASVFVLALLFIFLVLAAQFESFVDPLVILLAVPLSMVGCAAGAAA